MLAFSINKISCSLASLIAYSNNVSRMKLEGTPIVIVLSIKNNRTYKTVISFFLYIMWISFIEELTSRSFMESFNSHL